MSIFLKKESVCQVCDESSYEVYLQDTLGDKLPIFGYKFGKQINDHYRLIRCKNCEHIRASPLPENLYIGYQDNIDLDYISSSPARIKNFNSVCQKVIKICNKQNGNLLDVGCSTGNFLSVASEHFNAYGSELSTWAYKIAVEQGLKVFNKTVQEFDIKFNNYFDIIELT